MFDIGFPELMVVAVVALLVLGPERLPEALRTLGLWLGRLRRSFSAVKTEIEREIGMDDIRRQLHNEAILEEMKRIESEVQQSIDPAAPTTEATTAASATPSAEPAAPTTEGVAEPANPGVTGTPAHAAADSAAGAAADTAPDTSDDVRTGRG